MLELTLRSVGSFPNEVPTDDTDTADMSRDEYGECLAFCENYFPTSASHDSPKE